MPMKRSIQYAAAGLATALWLAISASASVVAAPTPMPADRARVLVTNIELFDTSGEGVHPDHAGRLEKTSRYLSDLLADTGTLEVIGPVDSGRRIRTCNGCEVNLARAAEADFVVTGLVYKVSTLVLSIRLRVTDAATGNLVAAGVADIRGDNDRSWLRGVEWLVKHRLLRPQPQR